jgi:hypothetical protein
MSSRRKTDSPDDERRESGYIFYDMSVKTRVPLAQGRVLLVLFLAFTACSPNPDRISGPPSVPPLSGAALGYAVVTAAYVRILGEPDASAVSLGVVGEGTVLTVLERRLVRSNTGGTAEGAGSTPAVYWVLVEGSHKGWLPVSVLSIYDSKEKAQTAAAGL